MSRFVLTLLALGVIAGCATVPRETASTPDWTERKALIMAMENWSLRGRVGVTLPNDGGKGRLTWKQTQEVLEMTFRGPFGAGGFQVRGTLENLELKTKAGEIYLSDDPEADLARELGWRVPLRSLGYWVRGIPDPNFPKARFNLDDQGLLRELSQSDWDIVYNTYRVHEGVNLPRKVVLTTEGVTLKLVADRWVSTD